VMRATVIAVVAAALAFTTLTACDAVVVDLGRQGADAASDGPPAGADATTCRCRITECRDAEDCLEIGGECGADFYCVGDFGACTTDAQCRSTVASSFCAAGPTSILACGE
jgi:hypothetical protein